ncbi:MAG: lasso peptide biosynthesis B2 protein [Gemmatimonas sp.]|nr:lasso peptide biosynthesis B2 protein [Gemmatimonas sp.]
MKPGSGLQRFAYRLKKLSSIARSEVLDLIVAQAALLRAWWWVRTRPLGELLRPAESVEELVDSPDVHPRLQRLALATERAAEHGLFPATCLVRAVALEHLIRRSDTRGAVVRIGVLTSGGRLLAHAWIEYGGQVLADRPDRIRHFTVLQDFTALPR